MRQTHQQEGPDVGDLVELHEEPQSLLVVAAVFAVDGEALPLRGKGGRGASGQGGAGGLAVFARLTGCCTSLCSGPRVSPRLHTFASIIVAS